MTPWLGKSGVRPGNAGAVPVPSSDTGQERQEDGKGEHDAFPWRACVYVYTIIVCNAVALSAPVSFLPAMVERRFHVDKDVEGDAVGLLVGAFSLAQFASSFFVGASPALPRGPGRHVG